MKAGSDCLVLDASVAVAWCFEEEKSPYSERIANRMADGAQACVPAVWPFEVANALWMAERRHRATVSQTSLFLNQLTQLDVLIDSVSHTRIFDLIISQSRQSHLTIYDAAYLELAIRKRLPLASLDEEMKKAAKKLGVALA